MTALALHDRYNLVGQRDAAVARGGFDDSRIARGVLDVDREAEVFEALRTAAASRQKSAIGWAAVISSHSSVVLTVLLARSSWDPM
jgi:hypothetical protein